VFSIAVALGLCAVALGMAFFGSAVLICALRARYSGWPIDTVLYGMAPLAVSVLISRGFLRFASRAGLPRYALPLVALAGFLLIVAGVRYYRSLADDERPPYWKNGVLIWARGELRFPEDSTHFAEKGIDTHVGQTLLPWHGPTIWYDIGELAGEHTRINSYQEWLVRGSRVRVATRETQEGKRTAVSFPDAGCANFSAEWSIPEEKSSLLSIASGLRAKSRLPWWLIPVLPEIVRSDCRHRCLAAF